MSFTIESFTVSPFRNNQISTYLAFAAAQDGSAVAQEKLYDVRTFDPQAKGCDKVYQYALANPADPAASALKSTYEGYALYLQKTGTLLTNADYRFLKSNQNEVPDGIRAAQSGGLHNVINDPKLQNNPATRIEAVYDFINHAVEANLYCAFNRCDAAASSQAAK
jgi:hypothetical protein